MWLGDSAYSIAWLALGNRTAADVTLQDAFAHMDTRGFYVWKEKSFGDFGHLNFITGAGGYLQNWVYGYGGVRYTARALVLAPVLPEMGVTQVVLRGLAYAGGRLSLVFDQDQMQVVLVLPPAEGSGYVVVDARGARHVLADNVTLDRQPCHVVVRT